MSKKITIFIICIINISCAANEYKTLEKGPFSSVSFSNLSLAVPEVTIIKQCENYSINKSYIESKLPTDKAKNKLNIPSNDEITFEYSYYWFSREGLAPISKQSGMFHHIEEKFGSELKTCTKSITFVPKENKSYEIYFGIKGNKCNINISEVQETNGKNILHAITTKKSKC